MSLRFRLWYLAYPAWLFFMLIFGPYVIDGIGRAVMTILISIIWGILWVIPMMNDKHSVDSFLGITRDD